MQLNFEENVRGLKKRGELFASRIPIHISRSPGRLDLMGGNDDYTGGLVFESTIREGTYAAAQLRTDGKIVVRNPAVAGKGWVSEIVLEIDELSEEQKVVEWVHRSADIRWTAYVLGNIHYLKKKFPDRIKGGLTLYMDTNVPFNRGVSSSAAIEVSVMKASAAAMGIDLSGMELAVACQWVENTIAGSACGIMDQAAVVTGKEGYIMPMICQPCTAEELIRLPEELNIWGIDSGVSHQVSGIEYEAARAAAFMGYKIICDEAKVPVTLDGSTEISRYTDPVWNGYLANLTLSEFREKFESILPGQIDKKTFLELHQFHPDPFTPLKDQVTYNILANTRYAVEENHRVQLFSELSRGASLSGSVRAYQLMGELMYQSHQAYTSCGLGARATDLLVELCRKEGMKNGIYGAKVTGGGAGGTVAILADKKASEVIKRIFVTYSTSGMGNPYLFEGSSDGADAYGIKVI
jgi:L-arabinokinase